MPRQRRLQYRFPPWQVRIFERAARAHEFGFGLLLAPNAIAALRSALHGTLLDTARAITSAADELRCDELADRDPLPFWGRGVVTLLGDAAHPLLPHTGQGAAQAIVNAVTLGTMLGAHADVTEALRSYERARIPGTSSLVRQGRRTAGIMRARNPLLCFARELAVRLTPVTPMVRLFARVNRRAGTDHRTHAGA